MMAAERVRTGPPSLPRVSRKALPPLEALRAFDAIARLGGVRRAAQYLCRDHGVVSRHLRNIEAWTGTKLIKRTAGGAVLTQDGVRYHRQIAAAMDAIASATVDLMRRGDSHRLHIRCMPAFALHWLSARLGDFEAVNPGFDIEVRPVDRGPEFLAHNADIDIRFIASYGGPFELPSDCRSLQMARMPVIAVASRDYLARTRPIREPRDLLEHQILHEDDFERWRKWLACHGVYDDVELTGPRLWQGHLTLEAARHGRGIALTNYLIGAEDLAARRLVEIGKGMASFAGPAMGVWLFISRAERWDAAPIRHFRSWLTATIGRDHPQFKLAQPE